MFRKLLTTLVSAACFLALAMTASAQPYSGPMARVRTGPFGLWSRWVPAGAYPCVGCDRRMTMSAMPIAPAPPPGPSLAPAPAAGDPYGFLNWLNATRAAYGLAAVGYDPALDGDCHQNNLCQAARGLGHHFMGRARRQNSAWNAADVGRVWMGSSAHQSALLDPTIRFASITWFGAWCTFSAY